MASSQPIIVYERNDPTLVFLISLRKTDGTKIKYPTTGRTWEFFIKPSPTSTDGTPISGTPDSSQDTATASAITVPLTSTQIGSPATKFYHLDAINAGRRETVALGSFNVVDV